MKKQLLSLVLMMLPMVASAYDFFVFNGDGKAIYYNYIIDGTELYINDDTELEVTNPGNSFLGDYTGNIVIPAEVTFMNKTRKVTRIGSAAFHNCIDLTSVTIPNSVKKIGYEAFYYCINLTSVTIGNSVTSIGKNAFFACTGLTSVTIGCAVKTIGDAAFYYCTGLTSVTIPNCVTSIGSSAFDGCSGLKSITIPNGVIGNNAFRDCINLTSVTIGSGVTSIGNNAFAGSDIPTVISLIEDPFTIYSETSDSRTFSLNTFSNATLYVPQGTVDKYKATTGWKDFRSIEEIDTNGKCGENLSWVFDEVTQAITISGTGAMYDYTSIYKPWPVFYDKIKTVVINDGVTSIGNYAFYKCWELTSITIPNSVTSIGGSAFYGCSSLASVVIPNSVTSIGDGAFSRCSCLTSVTIPNSVTIIGEDAFYRCSGLTSVTIGNSVTSIGKNAFFACTGLTSVTIGCAVKTIGDDAFYQCSGLTSVTIPNSVTSIGALAFFGCKGLNSVTIGSGVASIGYKAFDGADIPIVVSLIEEPFAIKGKSATNYRTFSINTFENSTLYVPVGTIDKYKTTEGWKDFENIVEGIPAGINVVEKTKNNITTIYDLNGVRQNELKRGVNIVDGRKVVVK